LVSGNKNKNPDKDINSNQKILLGIRKILLKIKGGI